MKLVIFFIFVIWSNFLEKEEPRYPTQANSYF